MGSCIDRVVQLCASVLICATVLAGVACAQPIRRSTPSFHGSPRGTSGQAARPDPLGGSASTVASTWSMWFWMTSLIAPVLS